MTSLIAWIAVDRNAPSAFYLASDSRISWQSAQRRWDAGRKLFVSRLFPDIFGFTGDVVFPALCLGQITESIDAGLLFSAGEPADLKHRRVVAAIKVSFSRGHNGPEADFDIVHASRTGAGRNATFSLWRLSYNAKTQKWLDTELHVPTENSALLLRLGSGTRAVQTHALRWSNTDQGGTSRAIFSAFCDAIGSGNDPLTGGAPQLVGMYHTRLPRPFGIVWQRQRFFLGFPLPVEIASASLEWRDELFQRLDGATLQVLRGAQRHVRPR